MYLNLSCLINIKDNIGYIILLFFIAALTSQRFLMPEISTVLCFIPFLFSIVAFSIGKTNAGNTLLLISLFCSVDNGAEIYSETSAIIRYTIYLTTIFLLISNYKPDIKKLGFIGLLLLLPIINTLINPLIVYSPISSNIFMTDIFMIILMVIFFSNKKRRTFDIDKLNLFYFFTFYAFFEIINYFIFFEYTNQGYQSYDSTKSLIVFPALYGLVFFKNNLSKSIIISLIAVVLIAYVTRQIILSFILMLIVFLIKDLSLFRIFKMSLYAIFISFLATNILANFTSEDFELIKIFKTISPEIFKDNFFDGLRFLDPARFAEHELFLKRNIYYIFFGSGLGSGIYDATGYLNFLSYDDFAFTAKELESGYYYNFHDVWIDIPVRFGVIPIIIIFYSLFKNIFKYSNNNLVFYSLLLFVLLTCQFFSTAGLLVISIIGSNYIDELKLARN